MKPLRAFGGTMNTVKELRWYSFSRIGHRRGQAYSQPRYGYTETWRRYSGRQFTVALNKWRCQHPHLCLPKQTCEFGMRK
jgi:hypothetical protein